MITYSALIRMPTLVYMLFELLWETYFKTMCWQGYWYGQEAQITTFLVFSNWEANEG